MVKDIFIFIFGLGMVLLNWPILQIFDGQQWKYLSVVWALLIVLNFVASEFLIRERL